MAFDSKCFVNFVNFVSLIHLSVFAIAFFLCSAIMFGMGDAIRTDVARFQQPKPVQFDLM